MPIQRTEQQTYAAQEALRAAIGSFPPEERPSSAEIVERAEAFLTFTTEAGPTAETSIG